MRVILVDGTSLLQRMYFAVSAARVTAGHPTNAVWGVAAMFRRVIARKQPDLGALLLDEVLPDLPAGFSHQIRPVLALARAHGFPVIRVASTSETVAGLCAQAVEAGHDVVIASGDKRFAQLVADGVWWMRPVPEEIWYDPETVRRTWGVGPDRIADWFALVGDGEWPGVTGIGEVTATRLLSEYSTLEAVYDHLDEVGRGRTALEDGEADALASIQHVRLRAHTDLDLKRLQVGPPDPAPLNALYAELGFHEFLVGVRDDKPEYFVCDTEEVARAAMQEVRKAEICGVWALWDEPDPVRGPLLGVGIAVRPGRALYFPVAELGAVFDPVVGSWLASRREKVVHDVVATVGLLRRHGLQVGGLVGDTQVASFLHRPARHLPHPIETVARVVLQRPVQAREAMLDGVETLSELSVGRAGAYGCHLADHVLSLWDTAPAEMEEDLALGQILATRPGMPVDPEVLDDLGREFAAIREVVGGELEDLAGHPINPASYRQVEALLFDELALPVLRRTRTGRSTAADVLERLEHPAADLVAEWRSLDRMVNTWTTALVRFVDAGRIRSRGHLCASHSGRILDTDPDLQRMPGRTEATRAIRRAFRAPPGHELVSADWDQLELRILAHFSGDRRLVEAFASGEDLHRVTAAEVLNVAFEEVTAEERAIGKVVNFATFYGQGPSALSQQLSISVEEARAYIARFDAAFAGVRDWQDEALATAELTGWTVPSLRGRRRDLDELQIQEVAYQAYGERVAKNWPIQASAADLCRSAIVRVDRALRRSGLRAQLLLSIHDELIYEVPETEVHAVAHLLRQEMAREVLRVPLVATVGWGQTWADAHPR